jgi:hypothetical protein
MKSLRIAVALAVLGLLSACSQEVDEPEKTTESAKIAVVNGETIVEVALADVGTVTVNDVEAVTVSALVEKAALGIDMAGMNYNFEADDGYSPATKDNCVGFVPVPGADIDKGYISLDTGELFWDESLGYPGCLNVKGLAKIIVIAPEAEPVVVLVGEGMAEKGVDISLLPTKDVAGAQLVSLADVLAASLDSPEIYDFGLEADDGFKPTVDKQAAPLAWEVFSQGYIDPATRDVTWPESLALGGFWSVKAVKRILLFDKVLPGAKITVKSGAESWEIDLSKVEPVEFNGETLVRASDVVLQSQLAMPETLKYDVVGSDGYTPTQAKGAAPLTFQELGSLYLHPTTRDVTVDEASGLKPYWKVKDAAEIAVVP